MSNNRLLILLTVLATLIVAISACSGINSPSPMPAPQNNPTNVSPTLAPVSNPTTEPAPTSASVSSGASVPTWWPKELGMPAGTTLDKEIKKGMMGAFRVVFWTVPNPNVDNVRDQLFQEGTAAGYQYFTSQQGVVPGKLYTVYIWKNTATYQLTLAQTSDKQGTKVQGSATGILHLKVTGSASLDMDLPITGYSFSPVDQAKSVAFSAEAPNDKCNNCFFAFGMDGSGYNGPATYPKWNDVRVNTGGVEDLVKIYRGPKSCTFVVKDELSGTFDCKGLHFENDLKKTIDVSGSWQIASQG